MGQNRLFTSESVTEGHPDKIADQISDAVLDHILNADPNGRVACETMVTTGMIFVAGEITTSAYVDIPTIARGVVEDVGYTDSRYGFDNKTCAVITAIDEQSEDIKIGVDSEGAGDQGMMFGFACKETDVLMPLPIFLAHRLAKRLATVRKTTSLMPYLRPDGKTQVTIEYENGTPKRVDTVVVSTQHAEGVEQSTIQRDVLEHVVTGVLGEAGLNRDGFTLHVNPTGSFVKGGPHADCGLTGRKIIVDTYGGMGAHGGGAFSGKDPSKVDRSASYAARHIAKNIVAADLADMCEVQLAYAIGKKDPVSVMINTSGTGKLEDRALTGIVRDLFDLTPNGIIERLRLKRGIYRDTAAYGHFGWEKENFTWERRDFVDKLKSKI
jgi:S-adenosylmethionine synthetase